MGLKLIDFANITLMLVFSGLACYDFATGEVRTLLQDLQLILINALIYSWRV